LKVETVADQLFFVTAYLTARAAGDSWLATGFVYGVETDQGTAHFLITNKHVFENAAELTVLFVGRNDDGNPALGKGTQITVHGFNSQTWTGHPDARVDVAAMPLAGIIEAMVANGRAPFSDQSAPSFVSPITSSQPSTPWRKSCSSATRVAFSTGRTSCRSFVEERSLHRFTSTTKGCQPSSSMLGAAGDTGGADVSLRAGAQDHQRGRCSKRLLNPNSRA
jgi:hypothetical protein